MELYAEYDYLFKILVVGAIEGKKELMERLTGDTVELPAHCDRMAYDFKNTTVEAYGKTVKLQVWNSPGQARFRTITSSHFRGPHGFIVVYDVADEKSFKNTQIDLSEIDRYACANVNKMLVGNFRKETERAVDYNTALEMAERADIPFAEISETSDPEDVLNSLACDILQRLMFPNGKPSPAKSAKSVVQIQENEEHEQTVVHERTEENKSQRARYKCLIQ
mmetsp:Transcript_12764/g.15902  ORF Transcript_12764/g.15902 Transcript_12764/m.15902 type:complete len:222 (-) Transcript_12764:63-728(-)